MRCFNRVQNFIMRRFLVICGFCIFFNCFNNVDCRVFCQDTNAKPWVPVGFTCPVVCATVLNAIERLIMLDYEKSVKEQLGSDLNLNNKMLMHTDEAYNEELRRKLSDYNNNDTPAKFIQLQESTNEVESSEDDDRDDESNFKNVRNGISEGHFNILENVKYAQGILLPSGNVTVNRTEDGKCWRLVKFEPRLLLGRIVRSRCTRKSNFDGQFVTVLTNVLNKYADTVFRFTNDMTEILLETIFGKNTELRNSIFDVNKLLQYLRGSVDRHKIHSHKHKIILKSRHCLTGSLPGCFCGAGYVESSGQCVRPEDCVTREEYLQYLTRIVVL